MVAVAITRLPRMCMPSPSFVIGLLLVMLSPPAQTTPRRGRPGLPRGVRLETPSTAVRSEAMQMPECGFAANELSVCTPTARQDDAKGARDAKIRKRRQTLARQKSAAATDKGWK